MNRIILPGLAAAAVVALLSGCSLLGGQSVQSFSVGQCVDDPIVASDQEESVSELPIVDCSEPHTGEVYYVEELTDASLPADVADIADVACYEAFESYVGIPYDDSVLYFTTLVPSQDTWDAGDRQIVCLIVDENGAQLTGSAKGTAQ